MNRRHVLAGAALLATQANAAAAQPEPGLAALAAENGLFYGAAAQARDLDADAAYANLIRRECACLVPEWEMKWQAIEAEAGRLTPGLMDRFAGIVSASGFWMRGHTLFWHESLPDWFEASVQAASDWDRVIVPYAGFVAERYGRHLRHWDVLNEAINPDDGRAGQLRHWRLTELFGEDFPNRAFTLAHRLAPRAKLFYNDYGLEYHSTWHEARRSAVLKALERWIRAGVPVHGLGIQGHLTANGKYSLDVMPLRHFLSDVAALGLEIVISELDVRETNFDRPLAERDQAVADETARFLEVVLDEPAVSGIVTWGCSDRYSWLTRIHDPRNRGLPFDAELRKKPMWHAIAHSLYHAPQRLPSLSR